MVHQHGVLVKHTVHPVRKAAVLRDLGVRCQKHDYEMVIEVVLQLFNTGTDNSFAALSTGPQLHSGVE